MARRKGWEELTPAYQSRLERGGVSRTDYESGASLKSARGHTTPSGIGEKAYASLRGLATGLDWDGEKPKDVIDEALARGDSPQWIRERLQARRNDTAAYRSGKGKSKSAKDTAAKAGKAHWNRRRVSVPRAWYWYH